MDSYLTFDSQISQFNIFMKKNQMPHVIFVNSTCLPQIYRYKIKTLKNKDLCVIIDVNCGRQEQNDHCQAPTYTNYPIFADKKSLGTQASSSQFSHFTLIMVSRILTAIMVMVTNPPVRSFLIVM